MRTKLKKTSTATYSNLKIYKMKYKNPNHTIIRQNQKYIRIRVLW